MCDRCAALEREVARLQFALDQKVRADVLGRVREGLGVTMHGARVLMILYRTPGRAVTHADLLKALPSRYTKSADGNRSEHYLRVAIYQLRREVGPGVIETVRGKGYFLSPHGADVLRAAMAGEFLVKGGSTWKDAA